MEKLTSTRPNQCKPNRTELSCLQSFMGIGDEIIFLFPNIYEQLVLIIWSIFSYSSVVVLQAEIENPSKPPLTACCYTLDGRFLCQARKKSHPWSLRGRNCVSTVYPPNSECDPQPSLPSAVRVSSDRLVFAFGDENARFISSIRHENAEVISTLLKRAENVVSWLAVKKLIDPHPFSLFFGSIYEAMNKN